MAVPDKGGRATLRLKSALIQSRRTELRRLTTTGYTWGLDLFEVRGIYDEDGGTVLAGFGGAARVSEYINDGLHVLLLYADEQCDVAPSQEAAGAGDTSYAVAVGYQLVNHRPGICVTDDGNDQFHLSLASQLFKALNVEYVDGRATHLCFDHHRLNFEQWSLDVSRDKPPPRMTALADVFQQSWQACLVEANEQRNRGLVQDTAARVHPGDVETVTRQHVRKCTRLDTGDSGDDQLTDNVTWCHVSSMFSFPLPPDVGHAHFDQLWQVESGDAEMFRPQVPVVWAL